MPQNYACKVDRAVGQRMHEGEQGSPREGTPRDGERTELNLSEIETGNWAPLVRLFWIFANYWQLDSLVQHK